MSVRRIAPSTLTARLVVVAVALVALVSVLIGVATTAALRVYLTNRLDDEVSQSHRRAQAVLADGLPVVPPDGQQSGLGEPPGQGVGTLTAYLTSTDAHGEVISGGGDRHGLSAAVLEQLDKVSTDGEVHAVDIPRLGSYRLIATKLDSGVLVTGLPADEVDQTVGSLVRWELLFGAVGVGVAGGIALIVVRRQLRPLREIAETARHVAQLPLAKGEIGVTARVPGRLTDEDTEVGQVGGALNTLLGHVEAALDARHRTEQQVRQFVADASHELRTPLATIHGYAELSRRTSPRDLERLAHALGKVEVEASRMSSLVEDLLLLARLDAGRPLGRQEVDLTKLVLEMVEDARVVAPDHRWVLELPGDPVTVTGDDQRLRQVLANLLSNARRHTPAGTVVTVSVHTAEDDVASVTVHDSGPGIPNYLQENVFERFTRGDSARTRASGGAGLGLSLARAIIEAHRGHLEVTSQPGSTCFTLTLPARTPAATP